MMIPMNRTKPMKPVPRPARPLLIRCACAALALGPVVPSFGADTPEKPAAPSPAPAPDSMLAGERAARWVSSGARAIEAGWIFKDGTLLANPLGRMEPEEPVDLDWPDPVGDFELAFEFQVQRMGWGGIEYRMPRPLESGRPSRGLLFTITDDAHHPLPRLGRLGNRSTGALYDILGPAPSIVVHPLGEWNEARIIARGGVIEHWINGVRVLQTDSARPEFEALAAGSIFRDTPRYGQGASGRLRLLRGDGRISYRNMRLITPQAEPGAPAAPPAPGKQASPSAPAAR